ncbi:GTPase ObgE [Sporohalobacter salinus]|uniref:GTPase ObgE n=1 Tax=Sporohalobacter salinus TaxID=1494606 RepID=UPI00195F6563|nr:GTPase ObgE [Sporohalobacter salinus]MBM7623110.1 GTP-binding protein [Sporohalobacter salinus]
MFVDEVSIKVEAGSGGDGATSFRREKYEPEGGPNGGDGGPGGDVILTVDEGLNTLLEFREKKFYQAESGENGQEKNKHGKGGEDLIIEVPPGTVVYDNETGEVMADMTAEGDELVVAEGGRGGRGNARFKSSTRQAPRFSENGEPGEKKEFKLELKLLADVGLVGFPNVGKSTLISSVSAAKPEIGNYHFTTVEPNLGVVKTGNYGSFVMADVPGLIEGAHSGVGLGDDFLRHLERTKVILHVLDVSGFEGRDPIEDFEVINEELEKFNSKLSQRPQIVAANKMDLPAAKENIDEVKKELEKEGYEVFPISAVTGQGIDELIKAVDKLVQKTEEAVETEIGDEDKEVVIKGPQPAGEEDEFEIIKRDDLYIVKGEEIERKVAMVDLTNEDSAYHFARRLQEMGIEDALKEHGINDGDTVKIGEVEFEYFEE